jgi:PadR family transcriptional regulator PadR
MVCLVRVSQNHSHREGLLSRQEPVVRDADYFATALISFVDECLGDFTPTVNLVRGTLDRPLPLEASRNAVVDYRGEEVPTSTELLQGMLDLLILQTLATGEMHGWGVAQHIQQVSKDVLQIGQGSLYPALHRLEYKGWIRSDWGNSENNRRAKFYSLTRAGKKRLETELEDWDRLSAAVALVLGWIPEASS